MLALGAKIVRELELEPSVDTLGRWLAHHQAELMLSAENAQGAERELAQSKAVINHAIDLMGREHLQQFAVEANATARQSPGVAEWSRVLRQKGLREAITWRDGRGGGSAP